MKGALRFFPAWLALAGSVTAPLFGEDVVPSFVGAAPVVEVSPPFVSEVPASTPATPDGPVLSDAPDYTVPLFLAVTEGDLEKIRWYLDRGADPNAELPHPPPAELAQKFRGTSIEYYVSGEQGLTPLMLISAMGNPEVAQFLMDRGADPYKKTRKNKTFALWLAGKHQHVEVMRILMKITPDSEAGRTRIRVDLKSQTAYVWRDGKVDDAIPISSGRAKFPTPKGRYIVTNKYPMWKSTIYRVKMPYFLRLSCGDFGLHAGHLPGYPASHGCIRLPEADAKKLFLSVPIGTLVEIQ